MPVPDERRSRWKWVRLGGAVLLLGALALTGRASGLFDELSAEGIRERVVGAGPLGVLLFLGLFSAGQLVQVPGLVFVAAGLLIYGPVVGFLLGMVGALCSVSVSFFVVRLTGGSALAEIRSPWARRILSRLEDRPFLTVTLLRLVLWLSPPLNYALALTTVRYHSYLLGSAVGLVPVVAGMALLFSLR